MGEIRKIANLKRRAGKSWLGGVLQELEPVGNRPKSLPPLVVRWRRLTGYLSLRLEALTAALPGDGEPSA